MSAQYSGFKLATSTFVLFILKSSLQPHPTSIALLPLFYHQLTSSYFCLQFFNQLGVNLKADEEIFHNKGERAVLNQRYPVDACEVTGTPSIG